MKKTILICALAVVLAGCFAKRETVSTDTTPAADLSTLKTPPPASKPAAAKPELASQSSFVTGEVAETMDAGGYTYLRLKTPTGDVWAAVKQTKVKVGAPATVDAQLTMDKFESKSLNRTFDHIVFGNIAGPGSGPALVDEEAAHASAPPVQTAAQHMKADAGAAGDVNVAKASGANARTVAETWAAKSDVKDKPVVIRGKVVKFLPGIMGRNWLHLRDGSGSGSKGDNDITVTTHDSAAVGDVVVVSGVVRVDKDFGAGYQYPVIIEEAKLSK